MSQTDARIILAGEPVNALGALNAGTMAAANANQVGRDNAEADIFRQYGAGILSGEPAALNALAGFNPITALDVRSTQQQMSERQERLAMDRAAAAQQAATHAANMTAAEREAEAARIRQGLLYLSPLYSRGDRAAFEAGVLELDPNGELGISWDNFESQAAMADGVLEVLETFDTRNAGPEREYLTVGGQIVDMNAEGGPQVVFEGEVAPETVVNVGGQSEFDEVFGREDAQIIAGVAQAGLQGARNLERLDRLEQLLAQVPTGMQGRFVQVAGEFGIATDGLSEIQAAQALINAMVPEQRPAGSGPMSDADLDLFRQSLPRIINSPEGNQMIIETLRAIAQYDAQGAEIAQRLRLPQGDPQALTRAEAFRLLQQRENPIPNGTLAAPAAAPTAEPQVLRYNLETGEFE